MSGTTSWFVLLIVGLLLVVIGFQGSLGKMFAVAFSPALLEQQSNG